MTPVQIFEAYFASFDAEMAGFEVGHITDWWCQKYNEVPRRDYSKDPYMGRV